MNDCPNNRIQIQCQLTHIYIYTHTQTHTELQNVKCTIEKAQAFKQKGGSGCSNREQTNGMLVSPAKASLG